MTNGDGRVALVTGGASGLGWATALRFAQGGMKVAIADLQDEAARSAAARLPGAGHLGIAMDVASEDAVHAGFEVAEQALGPVAVLACFAGLLGTGKAGRVPLAEFTLAEWERVSAVNARGTFLCLREIARRRLRVPVAHGRVITVSSLAGQQGGLLAGAAYSASKGAVLALTKVCARELAPLGITVNAIAPGPIDTPMMRASQPASGDQYANLALIPVGRVGQPAEIAAAAAYLASVEAAFVTGATIDINGGMRMQ